MAQATGSVPSARRILEVGCGVGDSIFPILETDPDETLCVYGCDFASNAIEILRTDPRYEVEEVRGRCRAFVTDISKPNELQFPFEKESLDFILCIFVLSALDPSM
jgi:ubiquinone/menaquinone biosynthesis C-methylase UbiE